MSVGVMITVHVCEISEIREKAGFVGKFQWLTGYVNRVYEFIQVFNTQKVREYFDEETQPNTRTASS